MNMLTNKLKRIVDAVSISDLDFIGLFKFKGSGGSPFSDKKGLNIEIKSEAEDLIFSSKKPFKLTAFKEHTLFVDFEVLHSSHPEGCLEIKISNASTGTIYENYLLKESCEVKIPFSYLDLVHDEAFDIEVVLKSETRIKLKKFELKNFDLEITDTHIHLDKVSIVIVTYNKYEYVRELIKSFEHINYRRDLLDIVVVDNKSADGTENKLKEEFGDEITIIQTGANLGGAGGFNKGMDYAVEQLKNEYIWLIDNDVVIHPNALNELLNTMKKNADAAAVGSMILQLDDQAIISEIGAFMDWKKGKVAIEGLGMRYDELTSFDEKSIEYSAAASLLKRKSAIEKIGYWRDYFIHYDDVDWCLRTIKSGLKIYCNPKSMVFHESMNKKQPTWIKYYNVRNLLYLYRDHKVSLLPFALIKFTLWSFYLFMHRLYKTSNMIKGAITDFLSNKLGKIDYPLEHYVSFDKYEWKKLSNHLTMIFYSYEGFKLFMKNSGIIPLKGSTTIFYHLTEDEKKDVQRQYKNLEIISPVGSGFFSTVITACRQLKLVLSSDKEIIFDGQFERSLMLPVFKDAIYVYPYYETVVDLTNKSS